MLRPNPANFRKIWKSATGFTLIELLVVIAILSLLTAIAVPSYRDHVMKSRRTEAKELLFTTAQRLQQYFTQNDLYTNSTSTLQISASSRNGYYTLTIAAGTTGSINTSYALTATRAGTQVNDTDCGNFMLNSLGTRSVSGSQTTPPCW